MIVSILVSHSLINTVSCLGAELKIPKRHVFDHNGKEISKIGIVIFIDGRASSQAKSFAVKKFSIFIVVNVET